MSIATVSPVYDLGTRADYLEFGVGLKKKDHRKAGTDRLAPGFYCDAPSIDQFIEMGNRYAEQNSRRVKAHSYVLSFHPDELDVTNPEDLKRAGDLGFLLAKKMRPNSPAMVVVHDDGRGGCVHAHITILNHDSATGKAPRDFRVHWQVKQANDALMLQEGMQVVMPAPKNPLDDYWAKKRGGMAAFDQQIGDAIEGAALDPAVFNMATFRAACEARGVEVLVTDHVVRNDGYRSLKAGDTAAGITYRMRDESTPGKSPRIRRRKASALSPEFTADGLSAAFEMKQRIKEQRDGHHGQARNAAAGTERGAADFGDIERVAGPSRRDRKEPEGGRESQQRDNAEHEPSVGGTGADAAADAAAGALRRVRERLAREDADEARNDADRDLGTAGQLQKRQPPRRISGHSGGRVRPWIDAEGEGPDLGVGDDELEVG